MHHRSHDREALDCSTEPDSSLESGSSSAPEDLRTRIHEAANWLAVLRGHVELAGARGTGDAATLSAVRRSLDGIERALAGATSSTLSRVDLGRLARDVAEDARRLRPGIDLFVEAPAEGGLVGTVADQALRDVLLNLIRNAAEALEAAPGGTIRVRVRPLEDGCVECVVEDDGPGMPAEVRERCFEPGFSTKTAFGRGLGLARVASLVEGPLGGTIDLASRPATGTRFRIVLPLRESLPAVEPVAEDELPRAVLVLDDDPAVGTVLVEMMQALGVPEARATTRVEDLLPACRGGALDVVVVDRDLGAARGDHLAIEVRQVDPAVAIVLLTGDPVTANEAPRGAIDAAVTKPIGLDALRRQLQDAAALTRRRRRPDAARAQHPER